MRSYVHLNAVHSRQLVKHAQIDKVESEGEAKIQRNKAAERGMTAGRTDARGEDSTASPSVFCTVAERQSRFACFHDNG
jgi:hypothetical protein